ncbi:UNVERIFIED_CONTAM: hypothetical protein RMT77_011827 [Armadillidium vulgare]
MVFQTVIHESLVKSEPDENMNIFCGSYPSPPPSPKHPTTSSEIKKESLEENFNFVDSVNENVPFDININTSCISIDKPSAKKKIKNNKKSSKLSKGVLSSNRSRKGRAVITEHPERDFDFKKYGYVTHCYVCENRVKKNNLRYHLYFGHVKCEDCGKVITSCLKFSSLNIPGPKNDGKCQHSKLDWISPPVDDLKRLLNKDEETFDGCLIQYLESLKGLSKIEPFKNAITYCKMYLKERECFGTNKKSTELDETVTVSVIKSVTPIITLPTTSASFLKKSKTKIKKPGTNSVSDEEDEFYLISRKVIEECPYCYEPFNPQDLIVDTNTCLLTITCKGCSLLVKFLLDLPDGSEPKLEVIFT